MRPFPILLGLSLISAPLGLGAADIDAEDFRRLVDRVNSHDEAIDAYRNTIQDLRSEVGRLRAENDRLKTAVNTPKNYATQEQITKLTEQLREVEKNRAADKQQVLDAFDKLKSMPMTVPVPAPIHRPTPTQAPTQGSGGKTGDKTSVKESSAGNGSGSGAAANPGSDKPAVPEAPMEYYEHTLAEGETLSAVIDAYNKQHGLKVRLQHVLKANPSVKDPKKLRLGQKLRIPVIK